MNPNLPTETFPKSDPEIVKLGAAIRNLMSEAMRRCRKPAPEVAEEMSKRLGRPITASMVYELTRNGMPQREIRLLATWVLAFCESTNDDRLQRLLAGPRLCALIAIGESVTEAAGSLARAQEAVARFIKQGYRTPKRLKR